MDLFKVKDTGFELGGFLENPENSGCKDKNKHRRARRYIMCILSTQTEDNKHLWLSHV